MQCELLLEFPKFLANMYEHYSRATFKNKKHYFLMWELTITLLKLSLQIYFLYKISMEHKFPAIFLREAIISIDSSLRLI